MRAFSVTLSLALLTAAALVAPAADAAEWQRGARTHRADVPTADSSRAVTAPATVSDPVGDTVGEGVPIDLTSMSAFFGNGILEIQLAFAEPVSPPDLEEPNALVGFIDLDLDQNGLTGFEANTDAELPDQPATGLGVEAFIDLFTYSSTDGRVDLVEDGTLDLLARVPVVMTATTLTVRVPLAVLGDDGRVDLAAVVGNTVEPTDKAPNSGALASTLRPTGMTACMAVPTTDLSPCVEDDEVMCLTNDRFEVTTRFLTPQGDMGDGTQVELTADSGYFWFFTDNNIEVVTKVLDACVVNDFFWLFAAGLTNVEVELRVRDTDTGLTQVCLNPLRTPFAPLQVVDAFPCS